MKNRIPSLRLRKCSSEFRGWGSTTEPRARRCALVPKRPQLAVHDRAGKWKANLGVALDEPAHVLLRPLEAAAQLVGGHALAQRDRARAGLAPALAGRAGRGRPAAVAGRDLEDGEPLAVGAVLDAHDGAVGELQLQAVLELDALTTRRGHTAAMGAWV